MSISISLASMLLFCCQETPEVIPLVNVDDARNMEEVTPTDIVKSFEYNAARSDLKFEGKRVVITGVIYKVAHAVNGYQAVVRVNTGHNGEAIVGKLILQFDVPTQLVDLDLPNVKVRVTGVCEGAKEGDTFRRTIYFRGCKILRVE